MQQLRSVRSREVARDELYVVVEGNRFSSGVLGMPRTLNFQDEPVCIGAVELDGSPGLEPGRDFVQALVGAGLVFTLGITVQAGAEELIEKHVARMPVGLVHTSHPLLVYAELSSSPDPRSQETARLILGDGLVR